MATSYTKHLFRRWFGKPLEIELVEACEAIPGLRKLGHNDKLDFDYLKIVDLAEALREELLPRGIVLIPNDLECLEERVETSEGRMTRVRIKTEFTVTNGWKSLKFCSYGSAQDLDGFALAAAQTMGLKAVLKRISLTYGAEDDPEVPRWAQHPPETTHQARRQLAYQGRAWEDAVRNSGKTEQEIEALLSEAMGMKLTADEIVALQPQDFDKAIRLIGKHSDLTEVLELSRKQAQAQKGPQRIEVAGD